VSQPKSHLIQLFSWIRDDGRAPATGIRRVNLEPTDGNISPVSVRSALFKVAGYPGNFSRRAAEPSPRVEDPGAATAATAAAAAAATVPAAGAPAAADGRLQAGGRPSLPSTSAAAVRGYPSTRWPQLSRPPRVPPAVSAHQSQAQRGSRPAGPPPRARPMALAAIPQYRRLSVAALGTGGGRGECSH